MKTIKELSAELKISEQALRAYCKKNNIRKERTQGKKPTYIIDCDTEEQIRKHYSEGCESESNETKEEKQSKEGNESKESELSQVLEVLRQQLEVKDRQIQSLTEALSREQAQLKEAQEQLKAAQMLHAGTIQQQLQDKTAEKRSKSGREVEPAENKATKNTGSGQQNPVRRTEHHSRKSERQQQSVFQNIMQGIKNRFR